MTHSYAALRQLAERDPAADIALLSYEDGEVCNGNCGGDTSPTDDAANVQEMEAA